MNKSRLLWILVAADVLLSFGSAGAVGFFGWTLPPVLRDYAHQRFSHMPGPGDVVRLALLTTTVCAAFVSWIGLLNYWRFARGLYLFSWASWILLTLYSGASVRPSVSVVFGDLSTLVSGMILGLVYFTDLAHRFERKSPANAAPSEMNLGARA